MLSAWVQFAASLCRREEDFYSGCRKIIRHVDWSISGSALMRRDGTMEDFGYTQSKQTMLTKLYVNEESIDAASILWKKRLEQRKYGSVGFSFHNHTVKGGMEKRSKRASLMGPCLQAAVVTLLNSKGECEMDIYYRTTEVLKKFPADLVFLRDVVMPRFANGWVPNQINFHFSNLTVHPMYYVTLVPHLGGPITVLEELRKRDEHFWKWCIKWSGRYLCPEFGNGIQKFAQAKRTGDSALKLIDKRTRDELQKYIRKNWPGVNHKDGRIDNTEEDEE